MRCFRVVSCVHLKPRPHEPDERWLHGEAVLKDGQQEEKGTQKTRLITTHSGYNVHRKKYIEVCLLLLFISGNHWSRFYNMKSGDRSASLALTMRTEGVLVASA